MATFEFDGVIRKGPVDRVREGYEHYIKGTAHRYHVFNRLHKAGRLGGTTKFAFDRISDMGKMAESISKRGRAYGHGVGAGAMIGAYGAMKGIEFAGRYRGRMMSSLYPQNYMPAETGRYGYRTSPNTTSTGIGGLKFHIGGRR